MSSTPLVIGLDFGTDSCRALVCAVGDGEVLGVGVHAFARWRRGDFCDAGSDRYRQSPQDHLDGLVRCVRAALRQAGDGAAGRVAGLGLACTASTPLPVDATGTPLALLDDFADEPDAQCWLWKDHTALAEASEFTEAAHRRGAVDYTRFTGGSCSPEWYWAKALRFLRGSAELAHAAAGWVEYGDWLAGTLCGRSVPGELWRNRCAAGHKAGWHASWGGLPPATFLSRLHPGLPAFRWNDATHTAGERVGTLTTAWARRLGLRPGIAVAMGLVDAHAGALAAGVRPGTLCMVLGTSTCDLAVVRPEALAGHAIPGISGQVDGSILPGLVGIEAGQSAFGDLFAWFRNVLGWTGVEAEALAARLEVAAAREEPGGGGLVCLDWFNGRRSPHPDPTCRGAIVGLGLGTSAPQIHRALVESACLGARAIVEHLAMHGVKVAQVAALGGIAGRSPLVMQTLADALGRPLRVSAAPQACALGAAMCAATAAGSHRTLAASQRAMGPGWAATWRPRHAQVMDRLWDRYQAVAAALQQLPASGRPRPSRGRSGLPPSLTMT